jgi:hypothetical protein
LALGSEGTFGAPDALLAFTLIVFADGLFSAERMPAVRWRV